MIDELDYRALVVAAVIDRYGSHCGYCNGAVSDDDLALTPARNDGPDTIENLRIVHKGCKAKRWRQTCGECGQTFAGKLWRTRGYYSGGPGRRGIRSC